MRVLRWIGRSVPVAAAVVVAAAPSAFAQRQRGQEIFEWNGRVDRTVEVSMRGNRLATRDLGNNETGRQNSRVMMQLPRQDGQVYVQLLRGRGSASVVEQPSAQNGYTAVVRIDDPSSGADDYRIAAYWQNYSNGDVYGRNSNSNSNVNGRDRDDRRESRESRESRDRNGNNNGNIYGNNNGRNNNLNLLHWSGNVDGELEIRIQNGRVDYRTLSGNQPTSVRADRGNASSQRVNGQVFVTQNQGRGSVNIVQQPSSYNGYTTVIRVRDPQGGYGFYDFDLMMQ
jgi:hypothetical protein